MKVTVWFNRKQRCQKILDEIDDLHYYLDKWGFAMKPSEIRKMRARIEKLREKLHRIEHRISK